MINKAEIFRKIGGILLEINDQYEYMSDNPDSLHELELELLAANAEFLSEHVKVLTRLNKSLAKTTETQAAHPPVETEVEQHHTFFEVQEPVVVQPESTEREEQQEPKEYHAVKPEPVYFEEPVAVQEEPVVIKEEPKAPAAIAAQAPVTPITEIADRVSAQPDKKPLSINDIISAQRAQQPNNQQSNQHQVTDLKSAISLNDKLLFIKELFNGYSLAYSEAIEILNRFDSFSAADSFLKVNYGEKNNWSAKQQAVDKFYAVLSKRFPK